MANDVPKGYFITGTDTDVGKTLVAAALLDLLRQQGHRVAAMKPVSCGCHMTPEGLRNADAELLMQHTTDAHGYSQVNPYAFEPPIAPHIAAMRANTHISLDEIKTHFTALAKGSDYTVVEGVGGWKVPLNAAQTSEDMARMLRLPVILVAGIRLGCLNHTLLTRDAIQRSGLPLVGWVANALSSQTTTMDENVSALQERISAPLLGVIPYLAQPTVESVMTYLRLPERPA